MTHQSKSYKKFVASAATATLVASALVPAASAATPAFTDVSKDYKEAVDYIVEHGFAKGTTDTTFGTAQNISRGDAAVMIANALKLDTANAKDAGFQDVNNRVEGAVNAIVEAGIASGRTSSQFDPAAYITRQEMAKMLANAYELEAETKAGFTDVNNNWIDYVSALKEAGITLGKTETTFAPTQNLTRGEFALFMFRAETMEVVLELKSATATDANTLSVTLSDDSAHTVTLDKALEANVATEVTFEIDGKEYTATVTWAVSKAEVVSVSAINANELQVKFNQAVDKTSATDLANYVFTINNNQYGTDYTAVTDIIDTTLDKDQYINLSDDGRTVTFKLKAAAELDNGVKYGIDVKDGVLTADGLKKIERYGDTQKVFQDNAAPKLLSAIVNADKKLELTFDEPVSAGADFSVTVDGQVVAVTPSTDVLDYTVVSTDVLTDDNLKVGTHNVVVYNARDFVSNNGNGGNLNRLAKSTYTVKAGVAPIVTKVEERNFNTFRVYFSKAVTDAKITVKKGNAEFYNKTLNTADDVNYVDVKLPLSTATTGGTAEGALTHLYGEGDSSVNVSLEVADFKDTDNLFGNKYNSSVTLKRDANTPKAVSPSKNNIESNALNVELNRENITVEDASKLTVKDVNGVTRTVQSAEITGKKLAITVKKDSGTLTTAELEAMGPFTVDFAANALSVDTDVPGVASMDYPSDEATNTIYNTAFSTKVANDTDGYKAIQGVADNGVTIASAAVNGSMVNKVTVEYKQEMGASAGNLANYTLDGDAFPTGTTISMDGDNKKVTITLPKETIAKDVKKKLVISDNVLTAKGEHIVGNLSTKETYMSDLIEIKDNVAPVLDSAKFIVTSSDEKTTDKIELTFTENVTGASDADNFIVIAHDGTELDATVAVADGTSNKLVLTITEDVNITQTSKVKVVLKKDSGVAQVLTDANGNILTEGTVITVNGTKEVTPSTTATVDNEAELTAALLDTNITKITLDGAIGAGSFNITRPLEIDLNGNNIAGTLNYNFAGAGVSKLSGTGTVNQVDVTTPLASFEQGAGVTITTLNLNDVAPGTYTNNGAITTANITDTDARFLNQGGATVGTLNVNTTGFVTLGGDAPLTNVVVTKANSVNVASGTTIETLEVNAATTIEGSGTVETVTGSTAPTVGKDVTVDNNASSATTATVSNESQLQSALKNSAIETITLANNLTVSNAVEISRAVKLDGAGKVLTVKGAAKPNAISGLGILSDNVTVENLTVKLASDAPLAKESYQDDDNVLSWNDNLVEIYNVTDVTLTNVNVDGSGKAQAGIYVNNDAENLSVLFDNIKTTGNRWAGVGINAKGSTTVTAEFKNVTAASFAETTPAVYSEGTGTTTVTGLDSLIPTAAGVEKEGFSGDEGKKKQAWWSK